MWGGALDPAHHLCGLGGETEGREGTKEERGVEQKGKEGKEREREDSEETVWVLSCLQASRPCNTTG